MKVQYACLECVVRQTCNTLAHRKAEISISEVVLEDVRRQLTDIDWEQTPADLSNIAYRAVEKYLPGDPFLEAKGEQNRIALSFYPRLKQILEGEENRLAAAVRIAATGNVIDLGIGMKVDIPGEVQRILRTPLPIDDTEILRQRLSSPQKILYIADNAGEIVFDRVFIEELVVGNTVTVAVRGGPVINDATWEDAESIGLLEIVPVITTGTNMLGIPWQHVSEQFMEHYQKSDLVISKGQANFETVSERHEKETFFILRAKCDVIAHELGVNHLDLVVKYQPASPFLPLK